MAGIDCIHGWTPLFILPSSHWGFGIHASCTWGWHHPMGRKCRVCALRNGDVWTDDAMATSWFHSVGSCIQDHVSCPFTLTFHNIFDATSFICIVYRHPIINSSISDGLLCWYFMTWHLQVTGSHVIPQESKRFTKRALSLTCGLNFCLVIQTSTWCRMPDIEPFWKGHWSILKKSHKLPWLHDIIYFMFKHSFCVFFSHIKHFLCLIYTHTPCSLSMTPFPSAPQRNPHDRFGKVMVKNLAERGCPLLSVFDYPSMEAQKNRFLEKGWSRCQVKDTRITLTPDKLKIVNGKIPWFFQKGMLRILYTSSYSTGGLSICYVRLWECEFSSHLKDSTWIPAKSIPERTLPFTILPVVFSRVDVDFQTGYCCNFWKHVVSMHIWR